MTDLTSRRTFLQHSAVAASAVALMPAASCTLTRATQLDLLIRGGTVVDGTGKNGFVADVGIRGDRIVDIGALGSGSARQVVDARSLLVAPGFIDVHAHSDLRRHPRAQSKVLQGVTLDIAGPDGGSRFPKRLSKTDELVTSASECGSAATWASEHGAIAMGIGSYVGHGTLRQLVLGPVGRPPTQRELRVMQDLVEQALEQGALGLSSGLEYFPGNMTSTDELVELCKVLARFDCPYVTHIRNEDDRLLEAVEEAIEISRRAGVGLLISHLKVAGPSNWHKIDALLERIERAREAGLEVRCDRYPYEAWSTSLAINFPGWAKEGGQFVARLKDPAERARMRAETEKIVAASGGWGALMLSGGLGRADRELVGRRVDEIAADRGCEPFELACELLTRGSVSTIGFGMSDDNMDRILTRPYCMVASDGSAVAATGRGGHPRSFGTFPRAFRRYVRELKLLSVEEMVRKMTSLPAAALRLSDRGVLAEGKLADVVVFDAERFTDPATYIEPQRYSEGVEYLVVNGVLAVKRGVQTDAMAGRIVSG